MCMLSLILPCISCSETRSSGITLAHEIIQFRSQGMLPLVAKQKCHCQDKHVSWLQHCVSEERESTGKVLLSHPCADRSELKHRS